MNKTVFLCGAISADKNYTEKFYGAETKLTALGYTVLNPIMLPANLEIADWLRITFEMVEVADIVAIFDDWTFSLRARSEVAYALDKNKNLIRYRDITSNKV